MSDEFSRERWLLEARWTVLLSNGETVIQDDGRPGTNGSAWQRLATHLQDLNAVRITAMNVQFRDQPPFCLPDNAEGYFFRKSAGAFAFCNEATVQSYLVGYLRDGKVWVFRIRVPEMLVSGGETRDPEDESMVGPSLIRSY